MGTRHLTCVIKDGKYKIAQYGQWDGYPEGQGIGVLSFLRDSMNRELFEKKLNNVSWLTKEELEKRWIMAGADPADELVSLDIAANFAILYPENSRDTGADVLNIVHDRKESVKLVNSIGFAKDSLFCEWAYVIDLDNDTLEVYRGFNRTPLVKNDRFFFLQEDDVEYYPVKLVITFALDNLPENSGFIREIKEKLKEE